MKKQKRVLFDWDGTLVDSMANIFRGACHVFESQGLALPSYEDYVLNFSSSSFASFYQERGVKLSSSEIFRIYSEGAIESADQFYPDSIPTFLSLRKDDCVSTVITANHGDQILELLKSAKLVGHVESVPTTDKEYVIREYVKQSAFGHRTPYLGDICDDMRQARKGGAYPVAVLRARQMALAQEFYDAGAVMCIGSLVQINLVLRQLSHY